MLEILRLRLKGSSFQSLGMAYDEKHLRFVCFNIPIWKDNDLSKLLSLTKKLWKDVGSLLYTYLCKKQAWFKSTRSGNLRILNFEKIWPVWEFYLALSIYLTARFWSINILFTLGLFDRPHAVSPNSVWDLKSQLYTVYLMCFGSKFLNLDKA